MDLWMHQFYKFLKDDQMILMLLYFVGITVKIVQSKYERGVLLHYNVNILVWGMVSDYCKKWRCLPPHLVWT